MRWEGVRGLSGAVAAFLLLRVAAQSVEIESADRTLLVVVSVAVFMFLQLAIVRAASALRVRRSTMAWLIPTSAAAVVGLVFLGAVRMPHILTVAVWALRDLGLICFAVSLGYTISPMIREPGILLPVAVFSAIVDFWSVNFGPLAVLLESKQEVVEAAAVQIPAVGVAAPISMIGVGDYVFLTLFFAVLHRFGMNVSGTFRLGFVLLTITMLLVLFVPGMEAVPALVPIAAAVVAANGRYLRLKRNELVYVVAVGTVLVAVLALSVLLTNRGRTG